MEVTGIDRIGSSLLANRDSGAKRTRDRYKKEAKNQQKMAIFNGLLRFADGAIQERHNNWATNESSRTVTRLLNSQQKVLNQRKKYEEDLAASNKTAENYELELVQKQFDDAQLGKYINGYADMTAARKRNITFGTGAAYDPEKDNGKDAGLYKTIARQRLDARNAWAEQLKDLDPVTSSQSWKKVNPYSKNLVGGALSFLKRTLTGTAKTNTEAAGLNLLDDIKQDSTKYERLRKIRAAGFSIDDAISKLNSEIVLTDRDKRGALIETKIVTVAGEEFETTTPETLADGRVVSKTQKGKTASSSHVLSTYRNTNGDISSTRSPITKETIDPETGKTFTAAQIKASTNSSTSYPFAQEYDYESTDYYTGSNTSTKLRVYYDNEGNVDETVEVAVDPTGMEIAQNVTIATLKPEVIKGAMRDLNLQYTKVVSLGDVNADGSLEDVLSSFAAFKGGTPASQLEAATDNFAGSVAVISSKIEDITEAQLGLSKSDTSLIAMQLMFIDKYSEKELILLNGNKQLNGLSATTTDVDPSKLLLAIDLLRANGSFAADKDGTALTYNNLEEKIKASGLLEEQESISGNQSITAADGSRKEAFYSPAEVTVIKQLRKRIDQLDGDGRATNANKRSLLDLQLSDDSNEDRLNFNNPISVYDLMTGDKFVVDPTTGKPSFIDEPAVTGFNNNNDNKSNVPYAETLFEKFELKDGDSLTVDTGNTDKLGKPVTQKISFNIESFGNGQVTVDRQAGAAMFGRDYNPFTIDQVPDGPIKNYLADLKTKFQSNINKLKDLGMSGEELTSRSLAGLGTEARRLKSLNGSILRQLNIESATKGVPGTLLPGVRNIVNRDERLNFFMEGVESDTPKDKNSLLTKPKDPEDRTVLEIQDMTLPDADSSVSDKLTFVANALGDGPNERAMMQELIWVESKDGTAQGTYEIDSKGQGSFGVAQVDRKGFDQVQKKINDPKSKYADVAASFKENAGIDLATTKYEDLNDDLLSIIYGRLYLAQITTDPIPDTVEGRADYWKLHYNTKAGDGTPQKYIDDVESR